MENHQNYFQIGFLKISVHDKDSFFSGIFFIIPWTNWLQSNASFLQF